MQTSSPVLPLLVLVPFTALSVMCAIEGRADGLTALSHPWAVQIALDLVISCCLVGGWMHKDARERGISALPFLVLLPFLGSISALLYLVRRSWVEVAPMIARRSANVPDARHRSPAM